MDWFVILMIWLAAPIVEAVIIIVLLAENHEEKKKKAMQTGYGTRMVPDESKLRTISITPAQANQKNPVYQETPVYQGTPVYQENSVHRETLVYQKGPVYQGTPAQQVKSASKLVSDIRDNLGTVSLIIGTVLVILSGTVFATARWQVLLDIHKVFLVFGASVLFFAVSYMAEKLLRIHRTGNAFYLLGSVFLFLTVLAAAYFGFLGPDFILDEEGRWKICWIGSLATEFALIAGLKRFHDRIYTQASLWGMAASICFMAKALGAGWNGLMGSMAWLGVGMVLGYQYMASHKFPEGKGELAVLVKEGLAGFIPVHFLAFCVVIVLFWLDLAGCYGVFACFAPFFSWERGLGCGLLCMGITALLAASSLYATSLPLPGGKRLGMGRWMGMPKAGVYSMAGIYALSGAVASKAMCRFGAASLWFVAVQAIALGRRRKAGQQETEKDLSVLWELCGLGSLTAGILLAYGEGKWVFGYLLLFSLYCFRFAWMPCLGRVARFLSSCFLAAAMWQQPFISWPQMVSLEINLVPAVILIFLQGFIWGRAKVVKQLQSIGYVCCLMVLTADALRTGYLADAIILELICLAAFIRAQVAKDVCWVRISGAFIVVTALFMTKGFWLSISWWAYLLAAGLGLILFAAVSEKKKR